VHGTAHDPDSIGGHGKAEQGPGEGTERDGSRRGSPQSNSEDCKKESDAQGGHVDQRPGRTCDEGELACLLRDGTIAGNERASDGDEEQKPNGGEEAEGQQDAIGSFQEMAFRERILLVGEGPPKRAR